MVSPMLKAIVAFFVPTISGQRLLEHEIITAPHPERPVLLPYHQRPSTTPPFTNLNPSSSTSGKHSIPIPATKTCVSGYSLPSLLITPNAETSPTEVGLSPLFSRRKPFVPGILDRHCTPHVLTRWSFPDVANTRTNGDPTGPRRVWMQVMALMAAAWALG